MKLLKLYLVIVACCIQSSCIPRSREVRKNAVAYFKNFEIRTDPVKVFNEIPSEQIVSGGETRYLKAYFNNEGLIEHLQNISGSNIVWECYYRFHSNQKIAAETWIEKNKKTERYLDLTGTVTNVVTRGVDEI